MSAKPTLDEMIAVMTAAKEGAEIEVCHRTYTECWSAITGVPVWDWYACVYRVKPVPVPPKLRWYTREEFAKFALRTPLMLVREIGRSMRSYDTGTAYLETVAAAYGVYRSAEPNVYADNFTEFEYSTDAVTWRQFGVEEG